MAMRWKGAAVALYTLCVGSLLLYSRSGMQTALGVALIVLASAAVVTAVTRRSADGVRREGRGRGTRRE